MIGIRWLAAAAHTGSGSILLWLLAAVFFFVPTALAVAALSARFPQEGGVYIWTREGFGDWHGFLCGWCYWLSNLFYFPNLLLAGVGMGAEALGFSGDKTTIIAISMVILWLALLTNVFGLGVARWTNGIGGLATYSAGLLLIVLGLLAWWARGSATPLHFVPDWSVDRLNFWSQIAFAFGGLELGAVMAGEIRDSRRTVPRAAWISGVAIAAFYILGTLAMLVLVPSGRINIMTGLVEAASAAGTRLGHAGAARLLTALILLGVAGQLGAWIGASARIPFAIGVDRYLPEWFARIHPRWRTPHLSILLQGAFCTVFVAALQAGENLRIAYQLLVDMTVITYFIPFAYLFAVAWKYGQRRWSLSGLCVTLLAIAVSLVPPADVASVPWFECKLVGGCGILIVAARLCFVHARRRNRSSRYNG